MNTISLETIVLYLLFHYKQRNNEPLVPQAVTPMYLLTPAFLMASVVAFTDCEYTEQGVYIPGLPPTALNTASHPHIELDKSSTDRMSPVTTCGQTNLFMI